MCMTRASLPAPRRARLDDSVVRGDARWNARGSRVRPVPREARHGSAALLRLQRSSVMPRARTLLLFLSSVLAACSSHVARQVFPRPVGDDEETENPLEEE